MHCFFSKKVFTVYNGVWGKASRGWGVFENFCVKSNLKTCKVSFSCKLRENLREQDVLLAPLPPRVSAPMR